MLIINGTAELMHNDQNFVKGTRHEFTMFSREMPFEQQLSQIEEYLVTRGRDNIEVLNNGVISNADDITHHVLQQAYEKAEKDGFAVTVNHQPLI
ncbi:hypothetical protein L3081_15995 [Colwellia sp. MSW7]|uniref:Uncharacterized protein n=1 Tax=Colwellia maritima TaxID=2912588 RepID=A0ABS9X307_9GAMM|nr:hypothetical protein [Colwellia maritima]MCI2284617.1 hypothetical protein [Colwellia maritima]